MGGHRKKNNKDPNEEFESYNKSTKNSKKYDYSKYESQTEKYFYDNEQQEPFIYFPCNHYITFRKAMQSAEINHYEFISCIVCHYTYDTFTVQKQFIEQFPHLKNEIFPNVDQLKKYQENGISYEKENSTFNDPIKETSDHKTVQSTNMILDEEMRPMEESPFSKAKNMNNDLRMKRAPFLQNIEIPVPAPRLAKLDSQKLKTDFNNKSDERHLYSDRCKEKDFEGTSNNIQQNLYNADMNSLQQSNGNSKSKERQVDYEREYGSYKENHFESNNFQQSSWSNTNSIDYSKGAITKHKASIDNSIMVCLSCCACFVNNTNSKHKQCHVLPLDQGVQQLISQTNDEQNCMKDQLLKMMKQIDSYEKKINASKYLFQHITKFLSIDNSLCDVLKNKGIDIYKNIEALQVETTNIPNNFAKVMNQRENQLTLKKDEETWIDDANQKIPMWLLSPWLKSSLAMLLFNAKTKKRNVYCQLHSDVFSQIEMEGDSILQYKFKRCKPNEDSIIIDRPG